MERDSRMYIVPALIHEIMLEKHGVSPEMLMQYDVLCLPENWAFQMSEAARPLYHRPDSIELCKRLNEAGAKCADSGELGIKTGEPDVMEFSRLVVTELVLGVVQIVHDLAIPILASVIAAWLIKKEKDAPVGTDPTDCIPRVYIEIIRKSGDQFDYIRLDMPADCAARVIAALPEENEGNE